jgi:hypothetical protein
MGYYSSPYVDGWSSFHIPSILDKPGWIPSPVSSRNLLLPICLDTDETVLAVVEPRNINNAGRRTKGIPPFIEQK